MTAGASEAAHCKAFKALLAEPPLIFRRSQGAQSHTCKHVQEPLRRFATSSAPILLDLVPACGCLNGNAKFHVQAGKARIAISNLSGQFSQIAWAFADEHRQIS